MRLRLLWFLALAACSSSPPCGPSTCAGCCAGTECIAGTDVAACGFRGVSCVACQAGDSCTTLGTCFHLGAGGGGGGLCSPANCAGCCSPAGSCGLGNTARSCGTNGAKCADCADAGMTCTANSCG